MGSIKSRSRLRTKPPPQATKADWLRTCRCAAGSVRIASFNIQVFGKTKLAKPEVMEVLAETVRRFDLVAIQEVRATSDEILPQFIDQINSTGRHYGFKIGPRQGAPIAKSNMRLFTMPKRSKSIPLRSTR